MEIYLQNAECMKVCRLFKELVDKYGGIEGVVNRFFMTKETIESDSEFAAVVVVIEHLHEVGGNCQNPLCCLFRDQVSRAVGNVNQRWRDAQRKDVE